MPANEKEKQFEAAQKDFRSAKLALRNAESKLDTAAAEYYQSRFGVTIGLSLIECPSEKIPPSLIVDLVRVVGGIYRWRLTPIRKDGKPAKVLRWLSAEAPIVVLGEYKP